ncbi:MAG: phage holin family protein [Gemmatimonadaceae bacterium]|jgi:putative membrane protein|nr:phage holin family protein [Gemmatimonadaceae bacterium]
MSFLLRLLVTAASLWVATKLVDGIRFTGESYLPLLGVALVFGAVNTIVKPVAKLLSFPVTILTLGLFLLVVNGLMLWLTSSLSGALGLGFRVSGFGAAVLGAIVVSITGAVLGALLPDGDDD